MAKQIKSKKKSNKKLNFISHFKDGKTAGIVAVLAIVGVWLRYISQLVRLVDYPQVHLENALFISMRKQ